MKGFSTTDDSTAYLNVTLTMLNKLKTDSKLTRSPVVAEKADRTAYDALINQHLDNKALSCS